MHFSILSFGILLSHAVSADASQCADLSGTYEVTKVNCVYTAHAGIKPDPAPGYTSPIQWPCQMEEASGSARAASYQPESDLLVTQVGCEQVSIELTNKLETTDTGYTFGGEQRTCTIARNNPDWGGEFRLDKKGLRHIDNRTYPSSGMRRPSKDNATLTMHKDSKGNLLVKRVWSQVHRERLISAERSSSTVECTFNIK